MRLLQPPGFFGMGRCGYLHLSSGRGHTLCSSLGISCVCTEGNFDVLEQGATPKAEQLPWIVFAFPGILEVPTSGSFQGSLITRDSFLLKPSSDSKDLDCIQGRVCSDEQVLLPYTRITKNMDCRLPALFCSSEL